MQQPIIHIVGAGLAGLAAAVRLSQAGAAIMLHEAAGQAGGRCRSYHDTTLDMTIDNGNHVVLSGNHTALAYLQSIGAAHRLSGPEYAAFPFIDIASRQRWCVRPNNGPIPWWIMDKSRRAPDTRAIDYLSAARLLWADPARTIGEILECKGALYQRLWQPLFVAALNTDPVEASASLAGAVIRETLAAGGKASRALIAMDGLTSAFVDPAIAILQARGGTIQFGHRLRALSFGEHKVEALDFGGSPVQLGMADRVILAVPPWVAASLIPGLQVPEESRAIVNAHFRITPPRDLAPMIGIVNGTAEWVFSFQNRVSVTISAAERFLDTSRETLAHDIWRDVKIATGIADPLPPWQIIKERRATFAALPQNEPKRPTAATRWNNLALAGDWTATGLPATIEGAIRSGNRAADLMLQ